MIRYLIFLTIQPQDESFLARINNSKQKHETLHIKPDLSTYNCNTKSEH